MRRCVRLIVLVWVASGLLLTGCRTAPETRRGGAAGELSPGEKTNSADDQLLKDRAEAHAHYAAGVVLDLNGETDAALEEFYQAALKDSGEDITLETAGRLLQSKKPEKAMELLQTAAKRPNASGAIYARLGAAYARLNRNEEAMAANQTAVKKSPRLFAGYRNLFFNHLETKQAAEALKVLDQAAKQTSTDAGFLIALGGLYASYAQQFPSQRESVNSKALAVLVRAEKLKPSDTPSKLQLADGFFLAGDMDRAATNYLGVLDELDELPQARDLVRDRLMKIYLREGDRKRAREQLEALVRDNPTNARAYYFLGLIANEQQRWGEAADYLKKAVLFSPNFEPAYYDLATAQIASGKADEALATLAAAKKKFPQNFRLEYGLGMANFQARNYAEALKNFDTAELLAHGADTNLLTHFFYYQMGAACERVDEHARARTCFEKCVALKPDFEDAYYDLANMLIVLGEEAGAAKTLETAKKKFSESFLLEYLFGALERRKKNFAGAARYFVAAEAVARAKETNRLTHFFYFDLGSVFERKGDYPQAEKYFETCLRLKPDFHEAQNYLGYMLADRGEQLDRAHELIAQALKAEPDNAAYLDSMGWVLFKQKQPKEALDYLLKAGKLSKEPDATLYDHLGEVYVTLNEMDKAREAWRKSLDVEKNDAVRKKLDGLKDK